MNPAKIEMRQIFGAFRFMVFEHCSILVLAHFVLAIILADKTSIWFIFNASVYLPLLGVVAGFLPDTKKKQ